MRNNIIGDTPLTPGASIIYDVLLNGRDTPLTFDAYSDDYYTKHLDCIEFNIFPQSLNSYGQYFTHYRAYNF